MNKQIQNSCLYEGTISHQRIGHAANAFSYSLFMVLLDLDEVETIFDDYWFWSARRPAIARFRRSDHYGKPEQPLAETIRTLVASSTGTRPEGSIRLLTHLSYFGHCFNPLSIYYCFDQNERLQDVVLEVSNTPWGEQHCYVLGHDDNLATKSHHFRFNKDFHVSPFLPMEMQYNCRFTDPSEQLYVSLDNYSDDRKVFGSKLALRRREMTHANMAAALLRDPLMTLRVVALIHWQAAKLWLKRAPIFNHPSKNNKESLQNG